ncbi:MAG: fumarylacetoacetate hydrolase family protein [Rhodospirillaceae bacterium]|jgi:2-keto-4-pentenoate hydratase/2-oxohepta-3-ene-1,7-dioic acid hydratase in catechol pathway|nr:fumarylacetoacetate hydrolase family protein [Rhodospirillaceae bacterium]MBT5459017.1 fumarylacetoacetate hydrolase family protein [Rhodospirillaceae bacterium]
MRFITFERDGAERLGIRDGDTVIDLSKAAADGPQDLNSLIEEGDAGLAKARTVLENAGQDSRLPLSDITYLPPTRQAGKIICLGLNYADHAAEGGHQKPEYPSFFMRGNSTLVAHDAPILRPVVSEQLDYEAELVAIVGKRARHVSEADALDYIWGYSVFNEASIREYQRKTAQWTIGKNFDNTGGFGPEAVTADEIPPGGKGLSIQTRLNGEIVQDANTSDMLFDVPETVRLLTECLTLEPGDILVMGTPSGVGHARTPQLWMKQGDICEVEIEKVGLLRNPIENEVV